MPRPVAGESMADYLHRFMGSGEAKRSFPKKNSGAAVAYSMFKKRKKRR